MYDREDGDGRSPVDRALDDLAQGLDEEARRQYGGAASAGSWLEGAVNLADVIKKAAGHHDDW